MKCRQVTKLDKRNKTTSNKFDDDAMSVNCDLIVIFPIYGQLGAIRKPDSGRIVCKTYIIINSNLLSYKKLKTELKNLENSSHTIALRKGTIFAKKPQISSIILTRFRRGGGGGG